MATVRMKEVQCRDHGGMFVIPARRGRPPVRCSPENVCDMAEPAKGRSKAKSTGSAKDSATPNKKPTKSTLPKASSLHTSKWCKCDEQGGEKHEKGIEGCKYATKGAPVTVRHNPCVVLGKKAKDQLEPQGWNLKGRAWFDEDDSAWAEVTGSRGEEYIAVLFKDGKFHSQDYSLWDADKTGGQQRNPMPRKGRKLPFNPDEMTDSELARELAGRTVTWWNGIAGSQETAIIGERFRIDHAYTGGNEVARQVHFVDKTPMHGKFRAFNVDALMRVK